MATTQGFMIKIIRLCTQHNLEATRAGELIGIICPKQLDNSVIKEIEKIVPQNMSVQFKVGPKHSTMNLLKNWFQDYEIGVGDDRTLVINTATTKIVPWNIIIAKIKNDGYFKSWEIYVNGDPLRTDLNEEIAENNKIRKTIIKSDDVLNLIILLNSTKDVTEFLKKV